MRFRDGAETSTRQGMFLLCFDFTPTVIVSGRRHTQVELFKSLRSINISDQQATEVVESVEDHVAMKVTDANAVLRDEVAALGLRLETEIGSIRAILESQRWFMGAIVILLAIIGLAPTFARIFR